MEYILTGKASIDKPWLKFYPESVRNMKQPTKNVEAFLKEKMMTKTNIFLNIMVKDTLTNGFGSRLI